MKLDLNASRLPAPFPLHGGKGRIVDLVWERFGPDVKVYSEPFAGTIAILLGCPFGRIQREIVSDTNGHIANFWRAMQHAPREVARWADYPTFHHDLSARHRWLVEWARRNAARLLEDPNWFDAQAAGWWVWGISNWVGSGWCLDAGGKIAKVSDKRPYLRDRSGMGGKGISAQRLIGPDGLPVRQGSTVRSMALPDVYDKRPFVLGKGTDEQGVSVQRDVLPSVSDRRPMMDHKGGGVGVSVQRLNISDKRPYVRDNGYGRGINAQARAFEGTVGTGERLVEYFEALAQRLAGVVTLNRDWSSAVTPTLLQHTPTSPKPPVAIFLDPPYRTTGGRSTQLYQSDSDGDSDRAAQNSYEWAVEHGDVYRIVYCAHEGDFPLPEGWDCHDIMFPGGGKRRYRIKDRIMFSPACLKPGAKQEGADVPVQGDLFAPREESP